MHYLIQDTQFGKILNFLQQIKGIHKNDTQSLRRFIEGVYYLSRAGCQLRLLPYYYGQWRAVHKRFQAWNKRGIWEKMFDYFKQDPDISFAFYNINK